MTTKNTLILALTLLTAGVLATSCSREDNIADEPQTQQSAAGAIIFTATLAPKGDDGGQTRAITTGTDGGKEVLNVAWATSEKIALYYQTASGYAKATATVQSVDATTGADAAEQIFACGFSGEALLFASSLTFANMAYISPTFPITLRRLLLSRSTN